jgi:hypothetical protein
VPVERLWQCHRGDHRSIARCWRAAGPSVVCGCRTSICTPPKAPVEVYRARLYTADELYAGLSGPLGYAGTPDARAFDWTMDRRSGRDAYVTMLRAIHDESMTDTLDEVLDGLPVVGVMGGHEAQRGSGVYAAAARLGHLLAEGGCVVATGGGPGAMEAANLGAYAVSPADLDAAIAALSKVPSYRPDVGPWAELGLRVREQLGRRPDSGELRGLPLRSIGIPTWFYGHEPPNVFGQGIAKYFSNALREDGLLARCTAGDSRPARGRRDGAGDLPRGHPAVLRPVGRPDGDVAAAGARRSQPLAAPRADLAAGHRLGRQSSNGRGRASRRHDRGSRGDPASFS